MKLQHRAGDRRDRKDADVGEDRTSALVEAGRRPLRALSHLAGMTDLEVPTLPGGRTDKARRTSVSVLDLDGHRFLVFGWRGADWAANARARQVGVLAVRQREERVQFGKLLPAEAVRILRVWYVRTPQGAKAMEDGHVPDLKPNTFITRGRRCAPFRVEAA